MSDNSEPTLKEMEAQLIMMGITPSKLPYEVREQYLVAVSREQEQIREAGTGLNTDEHAEERDTQREGPERPPSDDDDEDDGEGEEHDGDPEDGDREDGDREDGDQEGDDVSDKNDSKQEQLEGEPASFNSTMRGAPPRFGTKAQTTRKANESPAQFGGTKKLLDDSQLKQEVERATERMGKQVAANISARLDKMVNEINAGNQNAIESAVESLSDYIEDKMQEIESRTERRIVVEQPEQEPITVTGQHEKFADLLFNVMQRFPTLLAGPTGSGKTTAGIKAAEMVDLPFSYLALGPTQTEAKLAGYQSADGHYIPTEFYKRYRYGGVIMLDEMDAANPSVLLWMNGAVQNRLAAFPTGLLSDVERAEFPTETKGLKMSGGMVPMHPDCVVIASANTYGKGGDGMYVGRQPIDTATFKRFKFIVWDYDEVLEMQLAPLPEWTRLVQAVRRTVVGMKMQHAVSQVDSIDGGKMILAGKPWNTVANETIWAGLKPDDVSRIITHGNQTFSLSDHFNDMAAWDMKRKRSREEQEAS